MNITLKVSENTKEKMIKYFEDKKREKTPPYAVFQADESDTVVTLYESGKVVFQGVSADIDAAMWSQMEKNLNPSKEVEISNNDNKKDKDKKDIVNKNLYYFSNSIGSDEVGTGDYFGPVVVTAAFVKKNDIPLLEELGVTDSKKLTDEKILNIVPKFIKKIPHETILLSNTDYNNYYNEDINLNKIKAILHNRVLLSMVNKEPVYDFVIVDQFANPFVYYNYLKGSQHVFRDITFLTKAESISLSVACASLISRYHFIKSMDKLSSELGISLPYGSGVKADEVGYEIIQKYGFDKLKDYAKLNFKNTEKIKNYENK
ncbi:MAG: ribonuclease HIII [Bacilli bacterium]|nr:ribonuclease HIII [Bacilli bacterium]MDD4547913.1 ribonuclease HIII [Bacilli bacterium]